MSRLNKTEEMIKLAMLFQNSYCGLSIDDIEKEFDCSRRSAERMKTVLFDLFPNKVEEFSSTQDRKKRWRFKKGTMNFLLSFTADDFADLENLKSLVKSEAKQKRIDEIILKIKALTSQKETDMLSLETDVDAILETEGFAVRQYPRTKLNSQVLNKLREALLSFKKVKIAYKKSEEAKEIILHPYGVLIADKHYLVAYSEYRQAIQQYLVHKIVDIEVLDEYFERQDDFDLKKYSEKSFGIYQEEPFEVELIFDKRVAEDVLNYHFHPTQGLVRLANRDLKVTFSAGGTQAICWELFKWGDTIKSIKPLELKNIYCNYLKKSNQNLK